LEGSEGTNKGKNDGGMNIKLPGYELSGYTNAETVCIASTQNTTLQIER
jgi:hypothetical protein